MIYKISFICTYSHAHPLKLLSSRVIYNTLQTIMTACRLGGRHVFGR